MDLREVNLSGANLSGADLREADLTRAQLSMANLSKANLWRANLLWVNLSEANAEGADLSAACLFSATLMSANLSEANLETANLGCAQLSRCVLKAAKLTGTLLYGTARDEWDITGVECKYIFWDSDCEHRCPKDGDLEPGEFERLYATLPTIEYIFENGMSPLDLLIMERVVQAIREKNPEFDLNIDSISARGLAPSIRFTIQQHEHKELALSQVTKGYEERVKRLEADKARLYDLLGQAIDKAGTRLIAAGPGSIVATDGSTVSIQQHIHNAVELQRAIADQPQGSETFAKVAKRKALDVVGGAIQDFAKGQVKETAKQIVELGKELGPVILNTAAYAFFKSLGG